MSIQTENLSTALADFGTWYVERCSTSDCWCRMIKTDKNTNLDNLETPRLSTDGSDDMEFCIIPAGALAAKYANLVASSPKMLYALENAYNYLQCSDIVPYKVLSDLHEIIFSSILEARKAINDAGENL